MGKKRMSKDGTDYDLIVRGGMLYDGTGSPGILADIAVKDGRVAQVSNSVIGSASREVDASGLWVLPGFFDLHAHYDAEIEVTPGLEESVRHGVTHVIMGNCSLSVAQGSEEELLNLFCRVESMPREIISKWLGGKITWKSVSEYYEHLESLPLGPNVGSFLGHSNVRIAAMGYQRSMTVEKSTAEELRAMESTVQEAMDAGYLGLSIDLLPWHRIEKGEFQGLPVPSQHAHIAEHRALASIVRKANGVLQATPNGLDKKSVIRLMFMSAGIFRKALRVTVVSAMDVVGNRLIWLMAMLGATVINSFFRAKFRWQCLAMPFLNFADGANTPIFEEFATGVEAINAEEEERKTLFANSDYRKRFRADWYRKSPKMYHHRFEEMTVVSSPEPSQAGKTFAELAHETGKDSVDVFMDLMAEHGSLLRWKTVVGNDRAGPRHKLLKHPGIIPGFNDSGAHNQQMAFQDGSLQLLRQVVENPGMMSIEHAVHRLTGETADFLGVDAGTLREGDHADLVVINPENLKTGLGDPVEHFDEAFGGAMRLVRRSDGIVRLVVVGGKIVMDENGFVSDYGRKCTGRLLRAQRRG